MCLPFFSLTILLTLLYLWFFFPFPSIPVSLTLCLLLLLWSLLWLSLAQCFDSLLNSNVIQHEAVNCRLTVPAPRTMLSRIRFESQVFLKMSRLPLCPSISFPSPGSSSFFSCCNSTIFPYQAFSLNLIPCYCLLLIKWMGFVKEQPWGTLGSIVVWDETRGSVLTEHRLFVSRKPWE